ncbi:uncharacterized protein SAMN04487944_10843 [Gracilibacillus ureilyticus]|uniref:DUF418 domain-containing protein n=1 Tax=Gracilibacillus ureilyticus TaxID=531814 RepID=A0A1H9R6W3_9BACI|nr:DUF418 domain-containing protein [Gracilibacillus ureilyticus]SER68275.1 uncharacterized protein SAMN04487944_10843 [Gracilibacillus ureilyticus]
MNTNRISLIDGLRGFSLLGILLANLLIFQYGMFGKDEIAFYDLPGWDMAGYYFMEIFVETSFMPIFSFIFGYSLILMVHKLQEKQLPVKRYFFRRFLALMVFGLLHMYFIWDGDILFAYGSLGIILLMYLKRKPKTLLVWFIILASINFLFGFGGTAEESDLLYSKETITAFLQESTVIFQNGSYSEITDHRLNDTPMELSDGEMIAIMILAPFTIMPMFLLGMYAAHRKWLLKPQYFKKMALLLIPIGLLLKISPYFISIVDFSMTGGSVLALGYVFLFSHFYQKWNQHHVIKAFEKFGKLSLTNYILQSIIFTLIFYGYGLGLFAKLGVWAAALIGIVIYTLQVVFSNWYMNHFKQGPLERIIRMVVYWSFKSKPKEKKPVELVEEHG